MKILILGGDGYLGWPTAMHFSARGDEVWIIDNFAKRRWEMEEGIEPLLPIAPLHTRVNLWNESSEHKMHLRIVDLVDDRAVYKLIEECVPDTIIHYAEQPSAPYSMQGRTTAVNTQVNNIVGNLNLLFAMQKYCPDAHLVKLGTMGEYGTPNIDIEEGWLELEHNGRKDRVLYPKKPHSFYHLSKVHDSHNIEFACRVWGTRATDLNQGVVYGIDTDETLLKSEFRTSFHYDDVFGTVLNRFLVQAASGHPLTVYGSGTQTRGFLNLRDTIKCVEIAADNTPDAGEFRVFNQFTEQFSVMDLAEKVKSAGERAGLNVTINHIANPRVEQEDHYYNAKHTKLVDMGLDPILLTDEVTDSMLKSVLANCGHVDPNVFLPRITWTHRN
ncbi:NAD-dependent epimerase/dehydratase family protein [Magnetovibrio sp.]|uniref:NAD-dependent epimerase/dehydratase family protein n=1 Tax=Magnetovibrio sp. TaxID=2024836 RepID=UPI002F956395